MQVTVRPRKLGSFMSFHEATRVCNGLGNIDPECCLGEDADHLDYHRPLNTYSNLIELRLLGEGGGEGGGVSEQVCFHQSAVSGVHVQQKA